MFPDYSDITNAYVVQWTVGSICLDGEFTLQELRAIADRLDAADATHTVTLDTPTQ